jgi:hypothetical protein
VEADDPKEIPALLYFQAEIGHEFRQSLGHHPVL